MTSEHFGIELMTLREIFKNRLFTIPDYQRGYSWEEKQVEDLLKDIDHLRSDGMDLRHYTGTLVLSRPDGADEGEYHVVDGQQRLTTLVIFMRMLSDYLSTTVDRPAFAARYLWRGEVGSVRPVLCLNKDTHRFFEGVVLGDGNPANEPSTMEAHNRLLKSRKLIGIWLDERKSYIENIQKSVENELGFLVYAPKENAETGIMFEVINNRGKPLSELEKVKNYLIYCCVKLSAKETRKKIDDFWSDILRNLNTAKKTTPSDEGSFLRYCVAVYFKLNKSDSQSGYDELKKLMPIDISVMKDGESKKSAIGEIESFIGFLKAAALWYARLYGQQYNGIDQDLVPILKQLRAQAQEQIASIMPLFLALVIKLQNVDRLVELLQLLEILNFRVYMARKMTARNDTGQADLYNHASCYFHNKLLENLSAEEKQLSGQSIENEEDALEYRLVQFVLLHAADNRFKESFKLEMESPDDFYQWGGLRYFLMNYEVELQPKKTIPIDQILLSREDGKSADYLSVEHLWAKKNRNLEGENNRNIDKFEKRRLGNFILLELMLNIQGSNENLEVKLNKYLHDKTPTDLEHVRKMAVDAKKLFGESASKTKSKNFYLEFYRKLNSLQEDRYLDFAENRWSVKSFLGYTTLTDSEIGQIEQG